MLNMIKAIACMSVVLMISNAVIADEFETEAKRMVELSNALEPSMQLMDQMLIQLTPTMHQQLKTAFATKTSVTDQDISNLISQYRTRVVERTSGLLLDAVVKSFRGNFTLEELKDLNKLMSKPAFQAYAEKLPALTQTMQVEGQRIGQQLGQEIMKELIAENPKFQ